MGLKNQKLHTCHAGPDPASKTCNTIKEFRKEYYRCKVGMRNTSTKY